MHERWKPLSLFHLMYPDGDPLGKLLAIFSSSPLVIGSGIATLAIFRRDLQTISLFIGLLLNESVNTVIKQSIQQPRPDVPYDCKLHTSGMPSSHSQFAGFFCLYSVLHIIFRLYRGLKRPVLRLTLCLFSISLCVLTCYSRSYLRYHSGSQILVGVSIGAILGFLWYLLINVILSPNFVRICDSSVGRFLMLRDFTRIPDVFLFEYTSSLNHNRRLEDMAAHTH
ncbi:unnamed protein product [Dicrocoelium dendriticum]|nr:unnamed protein product [Dicrocoelium dendriticum]